mgnify:CR=1 FL=1
MVFFIDYYSWDRRWNRLERGQKGDGTEDKGEGGKKKGREEKRKGRKKGGKRKKGRKEKREENLITEVNLPTLIVKNNRFICSGTYLPGQLFFCRLPWRVLPKKHRWLHRQPRIHSQQTQAAVASGSPLPGIQPLP